MADWADKKADEIIRKHYIFVLPESIAKALREVELDGYENGYKEAFKHALKIHKPVLFW